MMKTLSVWHLSVLIGALSGAIGCGSDGLQVGNQLVCRSGETCESQCQASDTVCEVDCKEGSTCKATCASGKDCDFICRADAKCTFDCTGEGCQVASYGNAECTCSGSCTGTCGANATLDGGDGGTAGGNGDETDCVSHCGAPTDPGFAVCAAACKG